MSTKMKFMAMLAASSMLFTGCFGSMTLSKKVYDWNKGVSGNKFVQTFVFWGLLIVPVYEITTFVDIFFLNTVEFWTGSNPVAMGSADKEVQIVTTENNESFEITATQNRFEVKSISGETAGLVKSYVYNTEENAWYVEDGETLTKISQTEDGQLSLFAPDGTVIGKSIN